MNVKRKVKSVGKRLISSITAALTALSVVATSLPAMTAIEAEASTAAVTSYNNNNEKNIWNGLVIAQACKALGMNWVSGGKGAANISSTDGKNIEWWSRSDIETKHSLKGLDCSGLVVWTLGSLGVTGSGFNQTAYDTGLPFETWHYYTGGTTNAKGIENAKWIYNGNTYNANLVRDKLNDKTTDYWIADDGSTIPVGSIVIAKNSTNNQNDHAWIYIGEFPDRTTLINYLVNVYGVDRSLLTDKTVVDRVKGSTHWRIESANWKDGYAQVEINNSQDGKSEGYTGTIAVTNPSFNSLAIRKSVDGTMIAPSYMDDKTDDIYFTAYTQDGYIKVSDMNNDGIYEFNGFASTTTASNGTRLYLKKTVANNSAGISANQYWVYIENIPKTRKNSSTLLTVTVKEWMVADSTANNSKYFADKAYKYRWVTYGVSNPKTGSKPSGSSTIGWVTADVDSVSNLTWKDSVNGYLRVDFDNRTGNLYGIKYIDGKRVSTTYRSEIYTSKQLYFKVYDATAKKWVKASQKTDKSYNFTGYADSESDATALYMDNLYQSSVYMRLDKAPITHTYNMKEYCTSGMNAVPVGIRSGINTSGSLPSSASTTATMVQGTWTSYDKDLDGVASGITLNTNQRCGLAEFYNATNGRIYISKRLNGADISKEDAKLLSFKIKDSDGNYITATSETGSNEHIYYYYSGTSTSGTTFKFSGTDTSNYQYIVVRVPVGTYTVEETMPGTMSSVGYSYSRTTNETLSTNVAFTSTDTSIADTSYRKGTATAAYAGTEGKTSASIQITPTYFNGYVRFHNATTSRLDLVKFINGTRVSSNYYNSDASKIQYRIKSTTADKYLTFSKNDSGTYSFTGYASNAANATLLDMYLGGAGYQAVAYLPAGKYEAEEVIGSTSLKLSPVGSRWANATSVAAAYSTANDKAWTTNTSGKITEISLTATNNYACAEFNNVTTTSLSLYKYLAGYYRNGYDLTQKDAWDKLRVRESYMGYAKGDITFAIHNDTLNKWVNITADTSTAHFKYSYDSATRQETTLTLADNGWGQIHVKDLPWGNKDGAYVYSVYEKTGGKWIRPDTSIGTYVEWSYTQNNDFKWVTDNDGKAEVNPGTDGTKTHAYVHFIDEPVGHLYLYKYIDGSLISDTSNSAYKNAVTFKVYDQTQGKWLKFKHAENGSDWVFDDSGFAASESAATAIPLYTGGTSTTSYYHSFLYNLPVYTKTGEIIKYTVKEYVADGYNLAPLSYRARRGNIDGSFKTLSGGTLLDSHTLPDWVANTTGEINDLTLVDSSSPATDSFNRVIVHFNNQTQGQLLISKYVDGYIIKSDNALNSLSQKVYYQAYVTGKGWVTANRVSSKYYTFTGYSDNENASNTKFYMYNNASNNYQALITGLPIYDGNNRVEYDVYEVAVDSSIGDCQNIRWFRSDSTSADYAYGDTIQLQNGSTASSSTLTWPTNTNAFIQSVTLNSSTNSSQPSSYKRAVVQFNNVRKGDLIIYKYVNGENIATSMPSEVDNLYFTIQATYGGNTHYVAGKLNEDKLGGTWATNYYYFNDFQDAESSNTKFSLQSAGGTRTVIKGLPRFSPSGETITYTITEEVTSTVISHEAVATKQGIASEAGFGNIAWKNVTTKEITGVKWTYADAYDAEYRAAFDNKTDDVSVLVNKYIAPVDGKTPFIASKANAPFTNANLKFTIADENGKYYVKDTETTVSGDKVYTVKEQTSTTPYYFTLGDSGQFRINKFPIPDGQQSVKIIVTETGTPMSFADECRLPSGAAASQTKTITIGTTEMASFRFENEGTMPMPLFVYKNIGSNKLPADQANNFSFELTAIKNNVKYNVLLNGTAGNYTYRGMSTTSAATELKMIVPSSASAPNLAIYDLPTDYSYTIKERVSSSNTNSALRDVSFVQYYMDTNPVSFAVTNTFNSAAHEDIGIYNPNPTEFKLAKYSVDINGNREKAVGGTEINSAAKFIMYNTNTGKYVQLKTVAPGSYVYNGETNSRNAYTDMALATVTQKESRRTNGEIYILGLPIGDYRLIEDLGTLTDKYRAVQQNISFRNEGETVSITVDNQAVERHFKFTKYVEYNGRKVLASAGNLPQINRGMRFYLTDRNDQFVVVEEDGDDWNYVGTRVDLSDECYIYLDSNGSFHVKGIADGKYTVHEDSVDTSITAAITTNLTVDFTTDKISYFDTATGTFVENDALAELVNTPKYGFAKVLKEAYDSEGKTTDIDGITFNIKGTSDVLGMDVDVDIVTDESGSAISELIPVGTYTVTEKNNPYSGYVTTNTVKTIKVTADNDTPATAATLTVKNYKTEIEITKVDNKYKRNVTGATFTVYKDVNDNGTFEAGTDTVYTNKGTMRPMTITDPDGDGIYNASGFEFGNYLVKETAIDDRQYLVDPNYYAVSFTANGNLKQIVFNHPDGTFVEAEDDSCKITLTKRIRAEELDSRVWYEHGNPIFILELKNEQHGDILRHSFEFTPEYVAAHTFEEGGEKYVEMSYTWEDIRPGDYTASEIKNVRYTLKSIINIEHGTYNQAKNVAELTVAHGQEAKATFYNVKNTYKDLTHTCIVVNHVYAE